MSVAEAREDIPQGGWDQNEQEMDAALDRLILEVRAEMPCYRTLSADMHVDQKCTGYNESTNPYQPCPTCKARGALKVATP